MLVLSLYGFQVKSFGLGETPMCNSEFVELNFALEGWAEGYAVRGREKAICYTASTPKSVRT